MKMRMRVCTNQTFYTRELHARPCSSRPPDGWNRNRRVRPNLNWKPNVLFPGKVRLALEKQRNLTHCHIKPTEGSSAGIGPDGGFVLPCSLWQMGPKKGKERLVRAAATL